MLSIQVATFETTAGVPNALVSTLEIVTLGKVGVDARMARGAKKGADGKIYVQLRTPTGELQYKNAQEVADSIVAFPGELRTKEPYVGAMVKGRPQMVDRRRVDFEFPEMEETFSPLGNMVPMKSMLKGQRAVMAARMISQALPLVKGEAPLVQSGMPGSNNRSFEQEYAKHMGAMFADKPAIVEAVDGKSMTLRYQDGKRETKNLYENFPYNRKTYLHQTPMVKPGQMVQPGQLLAKSNYTDDEGTTALGMNARVAYIPWDGFNFEDANVVSASFAKKMKSEHAYQHAYDLDEKDMKGKNAFVSMFPAEYNRAMLENFDDDGIVKPGTTVKHGDPLILMAREKEPNRKSLLRGRAKSYSNETQTWEHHSPGVVTDVVKTPKGISVVVKSTAEMEVGDKPFGIDEATDVLTRRGWINVPRLTQNDEIASLSSEGVLRYRQAERIQKFDVPARMYRLRSQQLDLFVTANHPLYLKMRGRADFACVRADAAFGKRAQYKKDAEWMGSSPDTITFAGPVVRAGQSGNGERKLADCSMCLSTYLMLLGCFLSEGNLVNHPPSGTYGIDISQIHSERRAQFVAELRRRDVRFNVHGVGSKIRVHSKALLREFETYGRISHKKRIPRQAFEYSRRDCLWLLAWLMWGDGHSTDHGRPVAYFTTSPGLADDIQELCLLAGFAGNVRQRAGHRIDRIKGKEYACQPSFDVRIITKKLTPEVNHSHVGTQNAQQESLVDDYRGSIYGIAVSDAAYYVRRGGKPYWIGSGRGSDPEQS